MLDLRRRSSEIRVFALVVAAVQLASVTWVPIVHPRIHPDRALATAVGAFDTQTSGSEQLVLGQTMCVACMVSPNALPSPYRFTTPTAPALRVYPLPEAVRQTSQQSFLPTHPARAPPYPL